MQHQRVIGAISMKTRPPLCCQQHINGGIPRREFKEKLSASVERVDEVDPSLRLPQTRALRILIWSEGLTLKVASTKDAASECEI